MKLVFSLLTILLVLILLWNKYKEWYCQTDYDYDYDRENPNALVQGKNISGTVYSSNSEDTPGLGWVL